MDPYDEADKAESPRETAYVVTETDEYAPVGTESNASTHTPSHNLRLRNSLRAAWTLLNEPNPQVATLLPDEHPVLERWGIHAPAVRLVKFAILSLLGVSWAHVFGRHMLDEEYDKQYNVKEFWELNMTPMVLDVVTVCFLGRVHCARGRDSLWFAAPMLAGAVAPNIFAVMEDMQVSLTKQSIRCDWTAWTWFVGLWVVMLVLGLVGLHAYWAFRDKALLVTLLEVATVSVLLVGPAASGGVSHVHFHHWLTGILGATIFHFQRRFGMAAQGFLWGIYLNGLGCWGRGALLPCKAIEVMLRTDLDNCITMSQTTTDPNTGQNTTVFRAIPVVDAFPSCPS